ncbi:MAG TPA: dTMP kinase [Gaiellales bacterium]|nr:dTMP kinase [Gaiellales bacterium]
MFISFEGLDGSGKTTQAALLADAAHAAGREVVSVREPGGTAAGERIRALLLDPAARIAPWAEALLYAAARAELVAEVIRPALDRGATVIADRYVDSSLAYQGVARGLGVEEVLDVNLAATGRLLPDRTILLELPRDVAAARLDGTADRMEAEADDFHASVADGFADVARRFPDRVVVVDGSGEPANVAARVLAAVGL